MTRPLGSKNKSTLAREAATHQIVFPQQINIWQSPHEAIGVDLPTKVLRILSVKGRSTASQIGQKIGILHNSEGTAQVIRILITLEKQGKVKSEWAKSHSNGAIRQYWTTLTPFKGKTAPSVVSGGKSVNAAADKWEVALRSLIDKNKQLESKVAQYEKKFAALDKLLLGA